MWEPQAAKSSPPTHSPSYLPLPAITQLADSMGPTNKTDKTSEIRKLACSLSGRSWSWSWGWGWSWGCSSLPGLGLARLPVPWSVKTKASEASMCLSLWQRPQCATTTTRVGFFDKPPAQKPRAVYLNALAGTKTWGGWGGLCVLCLGCFLIDISKRISEYAKAFVQTTATETDAKWNWHDRQSVVPQEVTKWIIDTSESSQSGSQSVRQSVSQSVEMGGP